MVIPLLERLGKYYRCGVGLRAFLRDTLTLEQAKEIVRKRTENREDNFLKIVEKGIYTDTKEVHI